MALDRSAAVGGTRLKSTCCAIDPSHLDGQATAAPTTAGIGSSYANDVIFDYCANGEQLNWPILI